MRGAGGRKRRRIESPASEFSNLRPIPISFAGFLVDFCSSSSPSAEDSNISVTATKVSSWLFTNDSG